MRESQNTWIERTLRITVCAACVGGCSPSPSEYVYPLSVGVFDADTDAPIAGADVVFFHTNESKVWEWDEILQRGTALGRTDERGCVESSIGFNAAPHDFVCAEIFIGKYWVVALAGADGVRTIAVLETDGSVLCAASPYSAVESNVQVRAAFDGGADRACQPG